MEKHWLTRNPWVRLQTIFLGMAVIDLLCWDRRLRFGHATDHEFTDVYEEDNEDHVDDFDVQTLANLIGKPLSDGWFQYQRTVQTNARYRTANFGETSMRLLEWICVHDGSIAMRDNKGKNRARQQSCNICCQYNPKTIKCHDCGMPLCQVDRRYPSSQRNSTFLDEHRASNNQLMGCKLMQQSSFFMPDALKKYTATRQQATI